ncbi:hypothetical protein [Serratia marcescens]|uniref:hypothetical protein n=1 Tax=Serratia marcescens TaxID=615 RepID=UPI00217C76B7|nr:hypothetical protein [Serratia marcescens]CAI2152351.1 Uncharacterised protein [Serratia marcescens]
MNNPKRINDAGRLVNPGTATLWGYVQWDALSDLPLYWRNALVPLPLLVFMGMKHLQVRLNRADEHE